jgi:hypothetical protein
VTRIAETSGLVIVPDTLMVMDGLGNQRGKKRRNPHSTRVAYGPANDPFVISLGALDLNGSVEPGRATVASWSAWGLHLRRLREARAERTRPLARRPDPC